MDDIVNECVEDKNRYVGDWTLRNVSILSKICRTTSFRAYLVNPMDAGEFPLAEYDLIDNLLPGILTSDIERTIEGVREVFSEVTDIALDTLHSGKGEIVYYVGRSICYLLPIREERPDTYDDIYVKPKYFLPSLYELMETSGSRAAYIMEHKWAKQVPSIMPLKAWKGGNIDKYAKIGDHFRYTGTTVALRSLGISPILPMEICISKKDDLLRAVVNAGFQVGNVKDRTFSFAMPSSPREIRVTQLLIDGELAIMAYYEKKEYKYDAEHGNELEVLRHVCYDAWLLERIGNQKSKYVYSLFCEYRKWLLKQHPRSSN